MFNLPTAIFFKVDLDFLQTLYRGHGTNLVQEASASGLLKQCDGIIAVGGDGLVNEIATGLFLISSRNAGINPHKTDVDLPVTEIRLGIIPSEFLNSFACV